MSFDSLTKVKYGIRTKLMIGFMFIIGLLFIAVASTLMVASNARETSTTLSKTVVPSQILIGRLSSNLYASLSSLRAYIITRDTTYVDERKMVWKKIGLIQADIDKVAPAWGDKKYLIDWENTKVLLAELSQAQSKIEGEAASQRTGDNSAAANKILVDEAIPRAEKILSYVLGKPGLDGQRDGGVRGYLEKELQNDTNTLIVKISNLEVLEWGLLILGVVGGLILSIFIARSLLKPIYASIEIAKKLSEGKRDLKISSISNDETAQLLSSLENLQHKLLESENEISSKTKALEKSEADIQALLTRLQTRVKHYREFIEFVANGDLRNRLTVDGDDDLGRLGGHLNDMTENLSKIAHQITLASTNMIKGLTDVDSAVTTQVVGANEQNSAVNETTSIIEEIKATSNQTLEKAQTLGESAERTRAEGQRGLKSVRNAVDGMKGIQAKVNAIAESILQLSEKTQQIGDTTAAVSNLAQQSKLLALNASIEAAKAGEYGKGFAVVASEVKDLAEQSHQATVQVQKILQDIQEATDKTVMATEEGNKGVEEGIGLIDDTGDVVKHLSDVIDEAALATQQIVAAVKQEAVGIDQIAEAMSEINKATNQFVVTTEQTKSASESLTDIVKSLNDGVSYYKINTVVQQGGDHDAN